jgi:hypothetical protein
MKHKQPSIRERSMLVKLFEFIERMLCNYIKRVGTSIETAMDELNDSDHKKNSGFLEE